VLPISPNHLDKRNNVEKISIGLHNAEHAEIFNGFLAIRYTHNCSPVPLIGASDQLRRAQLHGSADRFEFCAARFSERLERVGPPPATDEGTHVFE